MKTKKVGIIILVLSSFAVMAFLPGSRKAKKPIYLNTSYSFKERAADLVSRMTPEEKQSQLGNTMPGEIHEPAKSSVYEAFDLAWCGAGYH